MTDAPTAARGAGHEDAAGIESPSSTRAVVSVRPLGTPMPLGLFGLAAASLVVSGLELGWISTSQRMFVGVVIVAFPVSLQLVASVLSFLSRDAATASGLGVLATTWLAIGAVFIISPPGSTSGALGLLLLVSAVALMLSGIAGALSKLVPAAVLIVSGARFAATGIYELSALEPWQDAAGAIGLGLTALALYTAFALELEDAKGRTVLPLLRRGAGRRALDGSLEAQLKGVESEAGVRKIL